ncbi:hypothetical protein EAI_08708 [Harpegnathos saltator]|uniref:Uncharacterized protein n=1 Tax=Harpegnathos saltator TaxID=610380 RepID=E2C7E3_HARSA|nr:hypothetical protein EAI_08708 [Harpegnathos saltator]
MWINPFVELRGRRRNGMGNGDQGLECVDENVGRALEKITALVGIHGKVRSGSEQEKEKVVKEEDTRKALVQYFTYVTTIRHCQTGPCMCVYARSDGGSDEEMRKGGIRARRCLRQQLKMLGMDIIDNPSSQRLKLKDIINSLLVGFIRMEVALAKSPRYSGLERLLSSDKNHRAILARASGQREFCMPTQWEGFCAAQDIECRCQAKATRQIAPVSSDVCEDHHCKFQQFNDSAKRCRPC